MKKVILSLLVLTSISCLNSYAQNSFPSNGNVSIGTTTTSSLLNIGSSSVRGTVTVSGQYPTFGLADTRTGGHSYSMYSGLSSIGDFDIFDQGAATYRLIINSSGNVGIGTTTPTALLSLGSGTANKKLFIYDSATEGSGFGQGNSEFRIFGCASGTNHISFGTYTVSGDVFTEQMRLTNSGNFLIGKTTQTNTNYMLDVNGSVRSNSIVVNTTGADFVFKPDYQLKPLSYVKNYIDENHHLPDIASASEMQSKGLDLGENQVKLLQKVEELTLYNIA